MNSPNSNNITRVIAVVAIIVIAGGALAYSLLGKKPAQQMPQAAITPTDQAVGTSSNSGVFNSAASGNTSSGSIANAPTYKDGTYTATGTYLSPGGDEKIGVTLTLKNDIVTSASVSPAPVSEEGRQFQSIFARNFKQYVVGKDISAVHLTNVSGSSLTPEGFNNALMQIEAQAKA